MLVQRGADERRMAGMWELPEAKAEEMAGREAVMRVKHSITNTNYEVSVYRAAGDARGGRWVEMAKLDEVALTGLARKILRSCAVVSCADGG